VFLHVLGTFARCPTRRQNQDYALYLLTACVHEARKVNAWETDERTLADEDTYTFDKYPIAERAARIRTIASAPKADGAALRVAWMAALNTDVESIEAWREYGDQVATLHGMKPYKSQN
jgi:hypothetical protein